jgi:hypothetical protein
MGANLCEFFEKLNTDCLISGWRSKVKRKFEIWAEELAARTVLDDHHSNDVQKDQDSGATCKDEVVTISVDINTHTDGTFDIPIVPSLELLIIELRGNTSNSLVVLKSDEDRISVCTVQLRQACKGFLFTIEFVLAQVEQWLVNLGHDWIANRVLTFDVHQLLTVDQVVAANHRDLFVPMLPVGDLFLVSRLKLKAISNVIHFEFVGELAAEDGSLGLASEVGDYHPVDHADCCCWVVPDAFFVDLIAKLVCSNKVLADVPAVVLL